MIQPELDVVDGTVLIDRPHVGAVLASPSVPPEDVPSLKPGERLPDVLFRTSGGVGEVLEDDEIDEPDRSDNCQCSPLFYDLSCWPCYREGSNRRIRH